MFRPAPTRCASATGAGDEREPLFSVNEFARLCAILYCDNTVRSSLIRSGLNLTRAQLDRGETRDEFWETYVSPRFNDCNCRPELELRGVLSGVDSTLPGAHLRSGEKLKGILFRSKKVFSTAYRGWELSGQRVRRLTHSRNYFPLQAAPPPSLVRMEKEPQFYFRHCGVELHKKTQRR
jgi:hypothetical protein